MTIWGGPHGLILNHRIELMNPFINQVGIVKPNWTHKYKKDQTKFWMTGTGTGFILMGQARSGQVKNEHLHSAVAWFEYNTQQWCYTIKLISRNNPLFWTRCDNLQLYTLLFIVNYMNDKQNTSSTKEKVKYKFKGYVNTAENMNYKREPSKRS